MYSGKKEKEKKNRERESRANVVKRGGRAAATAYVWSYETLQDPTPPPRWLVNPFLPGWSLPAIDRFHPTPYPLLSHSDLESQ